jgi:hypothetical protein
MNLEEKLDVLFAAQVVTYRKVQQGIKVMLTMGRAEALAFNGQSDEYQEASTEVVEACNEFDALDETFTNLVKVFKMTEQNNEKKD